MKTTKLIPITQFIGIHEGINIAPEHLELASLFDLPRNINLLTTIGSLKVRIRKEGELRVRTVRKVRPDDPLAEKYGVKNVACTMSNITGFVPNDEAQAKRLPFIASAGWELPDTVHWEMRFPSSATGAQVLEAVRISDEFFMKATEDWLNQKAAA